MKTYIADIIPKIQAYSKMLDELVKLSNHHWVSLDEIGNSKVVYIFRPENKLIISENGIVQRASWEYLGNGSMVIETIEGNYLLRQGFLDDNILAFKLDSTDRYVIFVNETRFDKELNNLTDVEQFLAENYINTDNVQNLSDGHIRLPGYAQTVPQYSNEEESEELMKALLIAGALVAIIILILLVTTR
jgi:hypothetical protein